MMMIIAVIRNECREGSRAALEKIGISGIVTTPVMDRCRDTESTGSVLKGKKIFSDGKEVPPSHKPGYLPGVCQNGKNPPAENRSGEDFISRTMLIIVTTDEKVHVAVGTLAKINGTGDRGDGVIMVCPIVAVLEMENPAGEDSAAV